MSQLTLAAPPSDAARGQWLWSGPAIWPTCNLPREEKSYVLHTPLTLPTNGGPPLDLDAGVRPQLFRYLSGHVTVVTDFLQHALSLNACDKLTNSRAPNCTGHLHVSSQRRGLGSSISAAYSGSPFFQISAQILEIFSVWNFVIFLRPMLGRYQKFGHDYFLPHPFQDFSSIYLTFDAT